MVVAGNHDLLFYQKPKLARANLTQATYLQDSGVTIEGLNFWGSPVNSVGEGWAFSRERWPASAEGDRPGGQLDLFEGLGKTIHHAQ